MSTQVGRQSISTTENSIAWFFNNETC